MLNPTMTERKRTKIAQKTDELRMFLSRAPAETEDYPKTSRMCIDALADGETCELAIRAIAKIFKETGNAELLDAQQKKVLYEAVLKCLVKGGVDLSEFIESGMPGHYSDAAVQQKYIETYPRMVHTRQYAREIIAMFVEKNPELIPQILKKHGAYLDMLPMILKYINVSQLDDLLYAQLYCDSEFFRENTEPRVIKGRKKLEFIEKALVADPEFVFENYIHDRDSRARVVIARKTHPSNMRFFRIMLNDPDENVRITVIKNVNWLTVPVDAAERLLDRSMRVREDMFRIFNEMVYRMYITDDSGNIFDKKQDSPVLYGGQLDFTKCIQDNGSLPLEKFMKFFEKVCEGCKTKVAAEYISIMHRAGFSLGFLAKNCELHGMQAYLETRTITDFTMVPTELRAFCLEYVFRGILTPAQIRECLRDDIIEVLKHIEDRNMYFEELLDKALSHTDLRIVELVVEFIGQLLKNRGKQVRRESEAITKSMINDSVIDDSGSFIHAVGLNNATAFSTPNEVMVNAHTRINELFVEQQMDKTDFAHLYFLVYQCPSDPRVVQNIKNSQITVLEKIRLLYYLNSSEALHEFVDVLLCHKLDYKTRTLLLARKTFVSTQIYFLCTGFVSISNPKFFVSTVKLCACSKREADIAAIFKKYILSLSQDAFDVFYSISWKMKSCVHQGIRNVDDSLIMNPVICDTEEQDQKTSLSSAVRGSVQISDTKICLDDVEIGNVRDCNQKSMKLRITRKDRMMYFICDLVLETRPGTIVATSFEPSKHGLIGLTECQAEMVLHGQVVVE